MFRRLKQIINGMFYGDVYTKRVFWSVFLVSILLLVSLIIGLVLSSWVLYGTAIVFAILDAIVLHRIELDVENVEEANEEDEGEIICESERTMNPEEKAQAGYDAVSGYTEKDIKQMFYKYKVKKNHRPVLIDSCTRYHIKECPAYAWTHRGQLHLLLLEKEPRNISLGLDSVQKMYYEKDVPANQRKEYDCLIGTSLVSMVFREYRPIYHSIIRNKTRKEVKNLYVIGPDMKFTPASAKELILLLQPEFVLQDEIMESEEYNQYFKQVYKQKVLLDDGVLNIKDYQTKVRGILQKLAEAAITPAAFRMTLTDMVQRQLISNEYAAYYSQYNRQYRDRYKK